STRISSVANRAGLAPGKTPLAVEAEFKVITPAEYKRDAHRWLILHGRYPKRANPTAPCRRRQPLLLPGHARALCARGGGEAAGQLATRTLGMSARISPCSAAGWAWTSPEIWPPHSI